MSNNNQEQNGQKKGSVSPIVAAVTGAVVTAGIAGAGKNRPSQKRKIEKGKESPRDNGS